LGCAALAYAGVGVLSPGEEADALGLFEKYCAGRSEGGEWGGARVWCKVIVTYLMIILAL